MKKLIILKLLLLLLVSLKGQELIGMEYFIDTDPGYGNAYSVAITPANELTAAFVLNLANVSNGLHWLGIRALNADQVWGNTAVKLLYIDAPLQHSIAQMEYFFDSDPGYGNAYAVSITPANEQSVVVALNTTNLAPGLHNLFIRTANQGGIWGNTSRKLFYYDPATVSDIVQMEYFIDNDPGYGLGQQVSIVPGLAISQAFEINTENLQPGVHMLYMRAKNAGNAWSMVTSKTFLYERTTTLPSIVQMEYYYDTDPGYGMGYPVPIAQSTLVDEAFTLDISTLSAGNHLVYFRVKDTNGKWSLVSHYPIRIFDTKLFVQGLWNPATGLNTKAHNATGEVFGGTTADTLSLVFRDGASPNAIAFAHRAVRLQQDGSCKTAYTEFPVGNYYIDVRHRNSLNTWSAAAIDLGLSPFTHDFTSDATQANGNNLASLATGVYGIYSGDVNQDGSINQDDVDLQTAAATGFATGYMAEDINGDGAVDALDLIVTDNNAAQAVSVAHP